MAWRYVQYDGDKYRTTDGVDSSLEDLTDVDIQSPQDGETIKYNSQTQKWENADAGGGIYPFSIVNGKVCITYQEEV